MTCGLLKTSVDTKYGNLSVSWAVLRPNKELCSYSRAVGCKSVNNYLY